MTVNQIVHLVAGSMVLLSAILAHYVHPYWIVLAIFVGVNLAQSAFTNFCPLSIMLKKAGVPEGGCS